MTEKIIDRREDQGTKNLTAILSGVLGCSGVILAFFLTVVWSTANDHGRVAAENSIKIARLTHIEEDIREIKGELKEILRRMSNKKDR